MTVGPLEAAIAEHIGEAGPIGFDEYVAHALYTPRLGFYAGGGGAGRGRDFLTAPEVGPLFGAVLARALDTWWEEMGRPDPYWVIEAGAGRGTLARSLLAAEPGCGAALRLVLVEPARTQWSTHPDGVQSRSDLPDSDELGPGPKVVLANELLDNLPFGLAELTEHGWSEVRVAVESAPDGSGPRLVERLERLDPARAAWCERRSAGEVDEGAPRPGGPPDVGARIPVQADAASWLAEALDLAAGGRVVVTDYCSTTAEMARRPWTDWLRTYLGHGRGGHPLDAPGSCDITVEVAVDQLTVVSPPSCAVTQADFLRAHGLDDLVAEGRAAWHDRSDGRIDLASIAARSRVTEAEALTDPAGLGGFRVLEWSGWRARAAGRPAG